MKKLIYYIGVVFLVVFSACEDTIEASLSENSILVYNSALSTMPLIKGETFYFVSNQDETLNFSSINTEGELTSLYSISDYLPDGQTSASLASIDSYLLKDSSMVVVASYSAIDAGDLGNLNYTLVKFDEQNEYSWSVSDSIAYSTLMSGLQSVYLDDGDNVSIVFSFTETVGQTTGTYILENKYSNASGIFVKSESLDWGEDEIIGVFPSAILGYYVFSTERSGPPATTEVVESITLVSKVVNSAVAATMQIPLIISSMYTVLENDDELLISGNSSEMDDETLPLFMSVNFLTGLYWYYDLTMNNNIYITSISISDAGYYISGAQYNGGSFDWETPTVLQNSQLFLAEIDQIGEVMWEQTELSSASIGGGVFKCNDASLRMLSVQNSFSTLSNIALFKTNEQGEIQ